MRLVLHFKDVKGTCQIYLEENKALAYRDQQGGLKEKEHQQNALSLLTLCEG